MRTPWRTGRRSPATEDPLTVLAAAVQVARQVDVPAEVLAPLTAALAEQSPDLDVPGVPALLADAVAGLYARGWQPADVAHVARRRLSQRAGKLTAAVVRAEAAGSRAADRAPRAWVDQLDALGPTTGLAGWWRSTGVDAATAWRDVARVLAMVGTLPALERLLPGPAGWPQQRTEGAPVTAGPVEAKVLGRVRGLLAKAERTEFPEEADALTAKAQQLMSRHAIDAAVLADQGTTDLGADVLARRLHLDDPYAEPKAHLLQAVATANGCRVVLLVDLGIATVVGLPTDLELVDLLFTSLLLQATRALADATRAGSAATRTPVFRRGFLYAYATRVGERLVEARERAATEAAGAYGSALVPVLARREEAVAATVAELFPRLRSRPGRTVDAQGWHAGRRAAEDADLGSGRTPLRG
ncbi:MAG: uncharacterized protein JWQ53_2302 [Klenkia sp.]|nr:uncharacterized protein [Klenkia sp.]